MDEPQPPIFTTKPAKVRVLRAQEPGVVAKVASKESMQARGREWFELHDSFRAHPKRVLMESDNDRTSQSMSIYAYPELFNDLAKCLNAAPRGGLAPIFVPSKGRFGPLPYQNRTTTRRLQNAKANLNFTTELNLQDYPDTLVFVLVEREEAVQYFQAFSPVGQPPLANVVFVVIPGENRGIRFARSCIVYLASSLRQALFKRKAICPSFDVFHTLDDDWRNPRVFDPALIGEKCMRPCSLRLALASAQRVMRTELAKHDGRRELLAGDSHPPGWRNLLEEAAKKAEMDWVKLMILVNKEAAAITKAADLGQLHDCLHPVAAADPQFSERFLEFLKREQSQGQKVAQVGVTLRNITGLVNYNCMQIAASSAGGAVFHHYRVSTDRRGCVTHYLPIYEAEQVNYLNDADFFLPQVQINQRLQRITKEREWFCSDRHFIRDVLEPRGIGGVLLFKCDLSFASVRVGGVQTISQRKPRTAAKADSSEEDKEDEEKEEEEGLQEPASPQPANRKSPVKAMGRKARAAAPKRKMHEEHSSDKRSPRRQKRQHK